MTRTTAAVLAPVAAGIAWASLVVIVGNVILALLEEAWDDDERHANHLAMWNEQWSTE